MTPFEQFIDKLVTFDVWFFAKLVVMLFMAVYLAFAVIVVKQVKLMTSVLNGNFDLPLKTLALIHLAIAITVFLMALAVL